MQKFVLFKVMVEVVMVMVEVVVVVGDACTH